MGTGRGTPLLSFRREQELFVGKVGKSIKGKAFVPSKNPLL